MNQIEGIILNPDMQMSEAAKLAEKMGLSLFLTPQGQFLATSQPKKPEWLKIWVTVKK